MQKTFICESIWKERLKGWIFTDCCVRSGTFLSFCLRQQVGAEEANRLFDHDILTKLFVIDLTEPGTSDSCYGQRVLEGYNKPRLGVAQMPLAQSLLASRNGDGQVSVMGGGKKFADEFIDRDKWPMTYRLKCVGGYAYSVGGGRSIYKRADIDKWVKLDAGLPKVEMTTAQGFNDLDAFSVSDMYAVGGHGDVWHYDGLAWKQMGFPSNVQLATVTCAGDGNVYISGEGGSLWVGKQSTWKRVYQGSASILWNDVLWFDGKLWLASDYQLRVWNGAEMVSVKDVDDKPVPAFGHMDARDGLLVVASPESVWALDASGWRSIVAPYA